ncbi:MAG: TPM domain-containing protein [Eubacterium sp.]|nr:TPM domain-containing protein [Eubacterium sp.]
MIKKISLFLMTLIIMLSLNVSAYAVNSERVVDNADLLSESEETKLLSELNNVYENQKFDVVVVTVTDLEGKSAMEYADDYYDYNGYGYGDEHDGCLLLIKVASATDRECWISTTGYGITALTDYGIDYILDNIIPEMKSGDYYAACSEFASITDNFVTEAKKGTPYDVGNKKMGVKDYAKSAAVSFIVAVVISLIIVGSIKKKYKPVRFKSNASDYLINGSLNLRRQYDNFTYTTVTKTKIEKNTSSGGSSTHSGSSGTSHGGGGRSF